MGKRTHLAIDKKFYRVKFFLISFSINKKNILTNIISRGAAAAFHVIDSNPRVVNMDVSRFYSNINPSDFSLLIANY
ncbi:MAG: hypothetical protein LBS69_10345 [Prevotellaceae bacterium]|nr:hypothetical protein [Prevotellaceae bacterium]